MPSRPWDSDIQKANQAAAKGAFQDVVKLCWQVTAQHPDKAAALLDAGAPLINCGFLTAARKCFEKALELAPDDFRPQVNLANLYLQGAEHEKLRPIYERLLSQHPDDPFIRRNALTSLEYDLRASDSERLEKAKAWGQWAEQRAGGSRSRPDASHRPGTPLKVGYVSADFCQHTVGLFVKDVLAAHNPDRCEAFAYSAGAVNDRITDAIRSVVRFRDVRELDDAALANRIRADEIDVLVDLSGHTAGSRLTAFAHRPAPVQVSWLGYFSTTGLNCIDAVLMDEWHVPLGNEALFSEDVIRLPSGRFCYVPFEFAPKVASPPMERNNFITFGSFNNTAKLNAEVLKLWARLLKRVPDCRLVLKWRTFMDPGLNGRVLNFFKEQSINVERIELRGPSFHSDMLREYGDIDIALDPFPFTGGLTTCEALWMGVPVVTWPQQRAVSRQSYAFLSAIGLTELSTANADDYVQIAENLALDRPRLASLRGELRERMAGSPLCDVIGFCRQLEASLEAIYKSFIDS